MSGLYAVPLILQFYALLYNAGMRLEQTDAYQHYLPFPIDILRTEHEALQELLEPCANFKTPFSLEERLRLFIRKTLSRGLGAEHTALNLSSGIPLNWQYLLRYLYAHGITKSPHLYFASTHNDYPKLYKFSLTANTNQSDGNADYIAGHSATHDPQEAISKTIGEMLERYFLTQYDRSTFSRSSFDNLKREGVEALDPTHCNSFLPWQIEQNNRYSFDEQSLLNWVEGTRHDGQKAMLPAQLVYWGYDFSKDVDEPMIAQPTTNGAGGHFTRDEAVLSGLLELIQRDGFLMYWLNNLPPERLDTTAISHGPVAALQSTFDRYGLKIHWLDITSDVGIPTVAAAIIDDRTEEPLLALGAATGFDLDELLVHAATEALSVLDFTRRQPRFELPQNYIPFQTKGIHRRERLSLWKGAFMRKNFEFFISGPLKKPHDFMRGIPQDLTAFQKISFVQSKMRALGPKYELYMFDVQHPALRAIGYHVVRVIVPPLMPLYLSEHMANLNSKRLRTVPEALGLHAADTLNHWPHPFP